jgi:hypothetical protein
MKLTSREMNVVLVALDHMEEDLEIVVEACKTARTKIKENNE